MSGNGKRVVHTGEKLTNPYNIEDNPSEFVKRMKENMEKIMTAVEEEVKKGGIVKHEDGTYEICDTCGALPKLM